MHNPVFYKSSEFLGMRPTIRYAYQVPTIHIITRGFIIIIIIQRYIHVDKLWLVSELCPSWGSSPFCHFGRFPEMSGINRSKEIVIMKCHSTDILPHWMVPEYMHAVLKVVHVTVCTCIFREVDILLAYYRNSPA